MQKKASIAPTIFMMALIVVMVSSANGLNIMHHGEPPSWGAVEEVFGHEGTLHSDGVYTISLYRDDTSVSIGNISLAPAMALDSWLAFAPMGNATMMMGDLVLRSEELLSVQEGLLRGGLDITAIHNTLAGETPQVFDVHVSGQGDPVKMAGIVRDALTAANVSYSGKGGTDGTTLAYTLDKGKIDQIVGTLGIPEDGVVQYRVPRKEKIQENGMEVPSSFDVATLLKFQPLSDNEAVVTGEYVLLADEVGPVFRALCRNGIEVTATHSHMLTEEPRLFYLHIWATGDAEKLARGLREALEQTNSGISNPAGPKNQSEED